MTLELGLTSFELIRVTAEYSNAVLVAVMPYIADVVQKLEIPAPCPLTTASVNYCSVLPNRRVEAEVGIKGGWVLAFANGHVTTIQSAHCYSMLQDPDEIPNYFGKLRMSKAGAVRLARDTLGKLDIPLESVFADLEPQVGGPHRIGTSLVPFYEVSWSDPRGGSSVDVEINGDARRVERIRLWSQSLDRPPPRVGVVPIRDPMSPVWPQVNPEYASRLIPFVLEAIDRYGEKLSLPVPRPLSTNHVARLRLQENLGGPYCELELSNGWRFLYEGTMVTEYCAPNNLFRYNNRAIRVKDLTGKWRLSEAEAKELVRRKVAKLSYPTNLVHFEVAPQVHKPAVRGIPRFMFYWDYSQEGDDMLRSAICAEVDADKGEVKSLYFGNIVLGTAGPKIEVPLLLPASVPTPTAPQAIPAGGGPPPRPLDHIVPPR